MNSKESSDQTLDYVGAYAIMMDSLVGADGDDLDSDDLEQLFAWEEDGEVSDGWRSDWEGTIWDLKRIPVADIWVHPRYALDQDKLDEYMSLDGSTAPPILLHPDGHPLDGQHRLRAAELRGDETILAWVPRSFNRGRIRT